MTTFAILTDPMTPPTDPFFVPAGRSSAVEVVRHTYDCFEVVAYGFYGQVCRRRMFAYGRNRRAWALEQAQQWADKLYLWFNGRILE